MIMIIMISDNWSLIIDHYYDDDDEEEEEEVENEDGDNDWGKDNLYLSGISWWNQKKS